MNKPSNSWLVGVCRPLAVYECPQPMHDIPPNTLICRWQRLGAYPNKRSAKKALKAAIAQGNVVSYLCLQDGQSATQYLYEHLKGL